MKNRILYLYISLLAIFTLPTLSAPLDDMFPGERVIFNEQKTHNNFTVALGTLKKINTQWITEKDITVDGLVSKKTIEIMRENRPEKALAHIEKKIRAYHNRLLFSCDGLTCGSSNAWANQRLGNQLLYGKDQTQSYRVWEVTEANKNYLVVAYTIQRGNQRIYAHLESVLVNTPMLTEQIVPSPRAVLQRLETYGFYEIGGLIVNNNVLNFKQEHISALVNALELKPFMRVTLVGHSYALGAETKRKVMSLNHAKALQALLLAQGIKPNRLTIEGVGGLAPGNIATPARVVVVKQ